MMGFGKKEISQWRDESFLLKGTKKVGVVLIHGWSSGPRQMKDLAVALNEKGYWVSAPCLRGHGTHPDDLKKTTWQAWAEDGLLAVKELKKEFGLKKVFIGGISMGGNVAIITATKTKVGGLILLGTPVHMRNHLTVWLGSKIIPWFKKYVVKGYPRNVSVGKQKILSYQFFPAQAVKQTLLAIKKSIQEYRKLDLPVLILQTDKDFLVAKYSPWIFYNLARNKNKKVQWVKSKSGSHVPEGKEAAKHYSTIIHFIESV